MIKKKKCLECGKKLNMGLKFCSYKCYYKNIQNIKTHICKYCKKIFIRPGRRKYKFCSQKCYREYFKQKKLYFWNSKFQSNMGKRVSREVHIRAGKLGGKKAAIINKKNRNGCCYDKKLQKKGIETQRKKKIGCYFDIKIKRKSGQKTIEILRKKSKFIWKDVHFTSLLEMQCAKLLLRKPIEGKNCHILIGTNIIDFFVNNIFIEYHIYKYIYQNKIKHNYYKRRRTMLDKNGYKGNDLLVFQNLNEVKKWVSTLK